MAFEFVEDPRWSKRLAVFDLETTGLDLREARIVTACVVEIDKDGNITGKDLEWLADPGIEIPEAASNVHGVTTEIARTSGRPASEVVAEIISALKAFFEQGVPVVAYNAPYDFTILYHEALRHGLEPISEPMPVVDPLVLDKFVDTYRSGKRTLEVAAKTYGVSLDVAHNATADAVAAGRVAQAIARKYAAKLPDDVVALHNSQIQWSLDQDASYEKFRRGSAPDFTVQRGWPLKL
jgi:DNA polymerase-3 subunit epsilon